MKEFLSSIEETFVKAEQVFDRKFERCSVSTVKRGSVRAADAFFENRQIRINTAIAVWYPNKMKTVILPHEVAHLVAYDLFGVKAWNHGPLWKFVMRKLGQEPDRLLSYLSERCMDKVVYECPCKQQFITSRLSHRKAANRIISFSKCSKCHREYQFKGLVFEMVRNRTLTCVELPEILK